MKFKVEYGISRYETGMAGEVAPTENVYKPDPVFIDAIDIDNTKSKAICVLFAMTIESKSSALFIGCSGLPD